MRTWIKVLDNLPPLAELIGHTHYGVGAFAHNCKFCETKSKYIEASHTVIYDSEMLDPPNNIQKVELCSQCSKPAIAAIGISR